MLLQVLSLLEKLNLSSYKEKFEAEQINGEVLLECDEELLQTELGVTSRLHRMRLTRVIQGRQSLQELLNSGQ